jgi:hypothetical protein
VNPSSGTTTLDFQIRTNIPYQRVTVDILSGIVFDNQGAFTNPNFKPVAKKSKTTDAGGNATFTDVNISGVTGYVKIETPGLAGPPSILTGGVDSTGSLGSCSYTCKVLHGYGGQ